MQTFFTRPPVVTFDRVPFQLTDELFVYGTARSLYHFAAMDGVTAAHLKETIVKTSEVRLEDEITDCDCSPYDHVRVLIVVS